MEMLSNDWILKQVLNSNPSSNVTGLWLKRQITKVKLLIHKKICTFFLLLTWNKINKTKQQNYIYVVLLDIECSDIWPTFYFIKFK